MPSFSIKIHVLLWGWCTPLIEALSFTWLDVYKFVLSLHQEILLCVCKQSLNGTHQGKVRDLLLCLFCNGFFVGCWKWKQFCDFSHCLFFFSADNCFAEQSIRPPKQWVVFQTRPNSKFLSPPFQGWFPVPLTSLSSGTCHPHFKYALQFLKIQIHSF